VAPRQTVALVGQTGCGKTTITNLLYRYFDPQTGRLEIDGHDVRDLAPRWYRRQLALVPQDPVVFDTTIAENIAYGRPHVDRARIEKAARLAELKSLVDRLPNGLDSRLGEDGVRLSLGEKQRVCIARAVLMDPAILILDEATSSLDSQSEVLIQKALKRIMAKRTCFVIAHRLSTIVEADLIVVIDKGRVLESGTHDQLCSNPHGRYRRLLEVQLSNRHHAEVAS
jgi:ATP-binding cassette subfamily B protein